MAGSSGDSYHASGHDKRAGPLQPCAPGQRLDHQAILTVSWLWLFKVHTLHQIAPNEDGAFRYHIFTVLTRGGLLHLPRHAHVYDLSSTAVWYSRQLLIPLNAPAHSPGSSFLRGACGPHRLAHYRQGGAKKCCDWREHEAILAVAGLPSATHGGDRSHKTANDPEAALCLTQINMEAVQARSRPIP